MARAAAHSNPTLTIARSYLAAGLGVIPIRMDGSKAPDQPPDYPYLYRLPTDADLVRWFGKAAHGIGVPGGKVSGHLETLDFETEQAYGFWLDLVEQEAPGLAHRLSWARTPGHLGSPGYHARYRCPEADSLKSQRLAGVPKIDPATGRQEVLKGKPQWDKVIETKGEGGYALAPGTPFGCHKIKDRTWEYAGGPQLVDLPTITAAERDVLLRCARMLDECERATQNSFKGTVDDAQRPGDDYNQRAEWDTLLVPHGWKRWREHGGLVYWTRPGKSKGVSASTGVRSQSGKDLIYVFTSSTDLEAEKAYTKFSAYAALEHGGDYHAAAAELGRQGYGQPSQATRLGHGGTKNAERNGASIPNASPSKAAGQARAAKAPVRSFPPFVPFPLHTLPPVLSEMVSSAAAAIGCNEALVALPALTVAAGCIGNSRALLLKRGWIEPCILWSLVVSDSGGQKTPAYSAVVDPLVSLQMDLYDTHKETMEEHKRALEKWQETAKGERGQKPEQPAEPETFQTSDTTIEALGVLLEDRPKGLLVARDEMDAWFGSFARYRGKGGGTDRPQWLELHRAGTLRIDRLTRDRKRVAVRRAAVSLTGTIQLPVLARALDEEAMQAGLGARFLLAMPPRRKRVWTENELPEETAERYQRLLRALLALPLEDEKKRKPYVLGLSSPAKRLWIDFYNSWAHEQFNADGEQAAAFAKIEAYASRFILLHHVISHVAADMDDKTAITEASARAGIEMARWFAAEAVRIYGTLSESGEQRESRRLVEHVRSHRGRITVAVLQRSNQRKYPTSSDAEAALEALVEAGLGVWEERKTSAKGGRPTRTFVLENAPYETYETPDDEDDLHTGGDDTQRLRNVGGHADFQAEDGVSYVSSHMETGFAPEGNPQEPARGPGGVSSHTPGVSSHTNGTVGNDQSGNGYPFTGRAVGTPSSPSSPDQASDLPNPSVDTPWSPSPKRKKK